MPKNLQKSLQDYLSKIKNSHPQIQFPSKKWINLKACKHPRTPSFSIDNKNDKKNTITTDVTTTPKKDDEATLDDIDRFLFENFKSLYLEGNEENNINNKNTEKEDQTLKNPSPPLDLYGSNKFHVTRDFSGSMVDTTTNTTGDEIGSSSSTFSPSTTILNDNSSSKGRNGIDHVVVPDNCVVVLASSPSPYNDFRQSMQGMVEARSRNNENVDWDFMEELLFCHINLNEKKSYKFILSAFVDLITDMRHDSEVASVKPRSVRTFKMERK